jgi:hypothetical protein
MKNFGSRMPLHMQNPDIAKAAVQENSSYESFRPNVVHPSGAYRDMEPGDRANIPEQYRIRRYPSGQLDAMWVANQVIDAIHKVEFNGTTGDPNLGSASLLPIECALLTVVFPAKYRKMEPQQAEIMTQLSATEKELVSAIVGKQMADEAGWNAGQGGGSVPGSRARNVGG